MIDADKIRKAQLLLELVSAGLLYKVYEKVRDDNRINRYRFEYDFKGADIYKGYPVNITAVSTEQKFKLDQFTIPLKLMGVSVSSPQGNNAADVFTLRIVDDKRIPQYIDQPITTVPLGMSDGAFSFAKGNRVPAFSTLEVLWTNGAPSTSKIIAIGLAFVRDFGSPLDSP